MFFFFKAKKPNQKPNKNKKKPQPKNYCLLLRLVQIANINQCALIHGAYMQKTICIGEMVNIYKSLAHVFQLFLVNILYIRRNQNPQNNESLVEIVNIS